MNSEKAVENFYNWEQKGRGYALFPYPVHLEPSYHPFYHSYDYKEYVDDGRIPTFFERLFPKAKTEVEEEIEEEIPPKVYEFDLFPVQIKIQFYKVQDFDSGTALEFLNMLSDSDGQISFEIIGKYDSLEIQIVCNTEDHKRILHLLYAYFPTAIISDTNLKRLPFDDDEDILIVDIGYDDEFMRPINTSLDSLTSILASFEHLRRSEVAMLQILFKGVKKPWANSILNSVSYGANSFFPDSPEMLICAKEKVSSPLFAVVVRLVVQSDGSNNAERLANDIILNIKLASKSPFNTLIPLSNSGYKYNSHLSNLKNRASNRFGMIMNSKELLSFIRFPNSPKYIGSGFKTKAVPLSITNNDYHIGINSHLGREVDVTLNDSQRLRHCHIIGATGTGKSTFISNLFLEDIEKGNGCVIFDPHGDTIDELIPHIPENRLQDVILIDPSDGEYSFGFNLLSAKSEVEKIVLSSDLTEAFRRHSTSWGDQMTSVLSNAINTFLYSSIGGTLIDLKRFLLDIQFRKEFLKTVNDPSIQYYWNNEFSLIKKVTLSPLLTRLDTFLRPRIIRFILSQKEGLDFNEAVNERKILLVKLSQGLIGEENSYLLGTLILSKIYQVAQARQSLSKESRHPYYIYLDEFQNFITPSINGILSGARKYSLGLILAHQELNQIKDTNIGNSILSNANIRICFRLGDADAKKLESGFSFFDSNDLQNLNIGEAVVRVGKNTDDFTLRTLPLKQIAENENASLIIKNSRVKYSKKVSEIEANLYSSFSGPTEHTEVIKEEVQQKKVEIQEAKSDIKERSIEYLEKFQEKEENREHRYLQTYIKKIAEQRGFKANLEEVVENGRIDVSLLKDSNQIACEIAVSNSVEYEVKNINKCVNAGYSTICIISKDEKHLGKIKEKTDDEIKSHAKIYFFTLNQLTEFLDSLTENKETEVKRIRGYRV